MTGRRHVEDRLDALEASTAAQGERPRPLSDEEREWLDEFFSGSPTEDHDEVMEEIEKQGERLKAEVFRSV